MRPDQRWFPTNRVDRAAWFDNFARKLPDYAPLLSFTQAQVDAVLADNEVVQFVTRAVTSVETYRAAVVGFQQEVLLGDKDGRTSEFPIQPVLTPPPMVPRGIFERLERTVRLIRAQPAYTESIGTMLGIVPRRTGLTLSAMGEFQPEIKTLNARSGYSFEIGTVRAAFSYFQIEVRRAMSERWELVKSATNSPVHVTVVPTTPGQAELVYVRIRMFKKNKPVGDYSNIRQLALVP